VVSLNVAFHQQFRPSSPACVMMGKKNSVNAQVESRNGDKCCVDRFAGATNEHVYSPKRQNAGNALLFVS
jgi:hypothetical protein